MSEQVTHDTAVVETAPVVLHPFQEESWTESPVNAVSNGQSASQQQSANNEQQDAASSQEQAVQGQSKPDVNEIIKTSLGFESLEAAKTEFEKLKNQAPAEIKYENEVSKKIHLALQEGKTEEVYSFLNEQTRLNKLTTGEVTLSNAEDIIKAAMRAKYSSDFTDEDIDYKFKKQFSIPKEPVQMSDEMDDDFEARKAEWSQKVKDAEREIIIEAKLMRPELEKLKAELKLPEIAGVNTSANAPSQEDLDNEQKLKESFLQSIEPTLVSLDGFGVTYKDEDVEIASQYVPSDEEKALVSEKLKLLADKNFNSNAIFAQRWVNEDNTLNVKQIAKDILTLELDGKVSQKLVTDTVNKRMVEYRKVTSNISVNGSKGTFVPEGEKSDPTKMGEFFFSQ